MAEKEMKTFDKTRSIVLPHQTQYWEQIAQILNAIKDNVTADIKEITKSFNAINSLIQPKSSQFYLKTLNKAISVNAEPCSLILQLIPCIAELALRVDQLFPEPIPLLVQGNSGTASVTRIQLACILANAFFNTIPPQSTNMQMLTLVDILEIMFFSSQVSKLTCIMEYFRRVHDHEIKGDSEYLNRVISVERRFLTSKNTPKFNESAQPLSAFKSFPTGLIEDAHGFLQADFANKYIGGGVLSTGNVQEEIRFSISPECLFSILICEGMLPNESIIITGAEKFSNYSGYGGGFRFEGPYIDANPVDQFNRSLTSIVCIDALEGCGGIKDQCQVLQLNRELVKSYCGFSCDEAVIREGDNKGKLPVASGNWGCGMFGGNKEVKTVIQWISASLCGRELHYYTFKDAKLTEKQEAFVKVCIENGLSTADLYSFCTEFGANDSEEVGLFEFITNKFIKMETTQHD